jgi:hypothetical protein
MEEKDQSMFGEGGSNGKWHNFQRKMRRGFVDNLPFPLLKRFRGAHLVTLGGLAYSVALLLFVLFFLYGYDQSLTSAFVAPSTNSGTCSYVKRPITGNFKSSLEGWWDGDAAFQHIRSLCGYTFNSLKASDQEFSDLITKAFDLGPLAVQHGVHDLSFNLISLITFVEAVVFKDAVHVMALMPTVNVAILRESLKFKLISSTVNGADACAASGITTDSFITTVAIKFPPTVNCATLLR